MGLVLDAVASAVSAGSTASISWNHTVGTTRPNRGLFVVVSMEGGSGPPAPTVTAGGVSMISAGSKAQASTEGHCEIFYLANPPTGTISIVVSFGANNGIAACVSRSYYHVNQSAPIRPGSFQSYGPSVSTAISMSVPTGGLDVVLDAVFIETGSESLSVGSGQTALINQSVVGGTLWAGISVEGANGAGSVTMSWTKSGGTLDTIACACAIQCESRLASPVISPFMKL